MTVNISYDTIAPISAVYDNGVFTAGERPAWADNMPPLLYVYGDGFRKNYANPVLLEVPSDTGYAFKIVEAASVEERIKNIEDALVELYELLEV